ncbi:uncharacterized protein At5g43822 isoform X2 [Rosa chinensis]|uniref:uncharacterized protein At5g43822 isoform X2 n=1 Tax=Rosa chinensis TaxID=74649 RepID=UPI001AD92B4D|nr:uncharacterized protein At5g43822 isoform X2 [Rosa chinensis]
MTRINREMVQIFFWAIFFLPPANQAKFNLLHLNNKKELPPQSGLKRLSLSVGICAFVVGLADAMEVMVKKYQHRFRNVRDEMDCWDKLQVLLVSQFRNASTIIQRLQVLQDSKNYGGLNELVDIQEVVLVKQMESLQKLLLSMKNTMEEFHCIVMSLGRIHRDGRHMIKGGSSQLSTKQLQQRVGVKPTLADCLDGLMLLQDMHCSEWSNLRQNLHCAGILS